MAEEIRFPRLGWSMEEGTFVAWLKQPGDAVMTGEPLFEMEGEKALQQIEALETGLLYVSANAPNPGTVVAVGTLLGYLLAVGEEAPEDVAIAPRTIGEPTPPGRSALDLAESHESAQRRVQPNESKAGNLDRAPAGPSVRRMARELKVELEQVPGTGKSGRITSEDIARHAQSKVERIASPRAKRVASELGIEWQSVIGTGRNGRVREQDVRAVQNESVVPVTSDVHVRRRFTPRRQAIAERLRKSLQSTIPVTITTIADVTKLVHLREQFKAAEAKTVPAYTDMLAKVVAETLAEHPAMAVRWNEEGTDLIAVVDDPIDIGIAVDSPEGLLVPVVRDVKRLTLIDVARHSKALIDKARSGRLSFNEMQGGVISISNLGGYGIDGFTPIINFPQIAILGMGAIRREPVFGNNDQIIASHRMVLSLTFDHAAIDGAPAAAFLQAIANRVLRLEV